MNSELFLNNKEFIGIIISLLGIVIPLGTFLITKNKEQQQLNFEKFHKDLMKGLANLNAETGLDQQVAILFELRNYPQYYPVIRRILKAQVSRWKNELGKKPHYNLLIEEATNTINYSKLDIWKRFLIRSFPKD